MTEHHALVREIRLDDDPPRLVRLLGEIEAIDQSGDELDEQTIRGLLETRGRALGWVVEDPANSDRLIAYTILIPDSAGTEADVMGAVHPAWRRRGIGDALMRRVLNRIRALGVTELGVYVDEKDTVATGFLLRRDFLVVAAYVRMRCEPAEPVPAIPPPAGFQIRRFTEIADPDILLEAMNRSYEGLWGHHQITRDVLDTFLPSLVPDGIFVASDETGEIAGMCRIEIQSRHGGATIGSIDGPGLVPRQRNNHPLRITLLSEAMRWLREHGHVLMDLESWGDDADTIQLYQAHGFRIIQRALALRRRIEISPPAARDLGEG